MNLLSLIPCGLGVLLLAAPAPTQQLATPTWQPGHAAAGPVTGALIYAATRWDPDGAGPLGSRLVIGGYFSIPSITAQNLAWFDPATQTWGAFATSPTHPVTALTALADGSLAVGGRFPSYAGATGSLAIFDGGQWTTFGGGVLADSYEGVKAIVQLPNGDVVVGGKLTQPDTGAVGLARWDGSQWHAYPLNAEVTSLAVRPNGNLLVGGSFPTNVAEWNGLGWTTMPPGFVAGPTDMLVLPNGDLVVNEGLGGMSRWNGTSWTPFGVFGGGPGALLLDSNGDLLAGGAVPTGHPELAGVYRWDGATWTLEAPGWGSACWMERQANGTLLVVGSAKMDNPDRVRGIATWNGTAWQPATTGFDDVVRGVAALPDGGLAAYGAFRLAENAIANGWATRQSGSWDGARPTGLPLPLTLHAHSATGELWLIGGNYSSAGTIGVLSGQTFTALPEPIPGAAALTFDDSGAPIVGRSIFPVSGPNVMRWDGAQWVQLGGTRVDGPVHAVGHTGDGDLVVGGNFLFVGPTWLSHVARFDGTTWQPMAAGLDGIVRTFATLPNGDLIAAGEFQNDGWMVQPLPLVARWDGAAWQPLGAGLQGPPGAQVLTLLVLPNGDLLAGGDFTHIGSTLGGTPARGVARWDGAAWHAVDGGVDGVVQSLTMTKDGEVWASGSFGQAGGANSAYIARLVTDQPATATSYGTGCAGSAGPLALHVDELPWLGGAFRASCAPVATNAIGVVLFGFTATSLPLSTLHPAAGANCSLLSSGELAWLQLPANGALTAELPLPENAALLGATFHCQVLAAELAPAGIALLAGSDGVTLTLGAF